MELMKMEVRGCRARRRGSEGLARGPSSPAPPQTLGKGLNLASPSFLLCRMERGRGNLWLGVLKWHLAKLWRSRRLGRTPGRCPQFSQNSFFPFLFYMLGWYPPLWVEQRIRGQKEKKFETRQCMFRVPPSFRISKSLLEGQRLCPGGLICYGHAL